MSETGDLSGPSNSNNTPAWIREPAADVTIEENWLIRLTKQRYRSVSSGKPYDYYVVHLPDAVNVIALTTNREILLVEQFRAGSGQPSLEPPGGMLDPGEDPLEAAVRELREETGYEGDPPILLGTVWSCPSLLTSRTTTVLITNVRPVGETKLDEGEEVRLVRVPAARVPHLIHGGEISHALAVQGLFWWLVSELPETPFELPPRARPEARRWNLQSLMVAIAVVALAIAALKEIGSPQGPTHWLLPHMLLLPLSAWLVERGLDPPPRTTLTRSKPRYGARIILKLLAALGLNQLLLGGALIALRFLR